MVKETNIKKMVEESARACLVNATEAESWVSASAKTNSEKGVGIQKQIQLRKSG